MAGMLSASRVFQDYEQAFTRASGLPLRLTVDGCPSVQVRTDDNPFCSLMTKLHPGCGACLDLRRQLHDEARIQPATVTCFAGLCETAVPVRVGDGMLVFLETGHVFHELPNRGLFKPVAARLLEWGARVDLKRAEEAWLAGHVIPRENYDAFVSLLSVFADHLASCGRMLMQDAVSDHDSERMAKAKAFVQVNIGDHLTLHQVARVVNLSAHYFCRKFKDSTGLSFTQFLTRTRVERARQMLEDPAIRVNEAAFAAGFQSISQFNRAFRTIVGVTPTQYRAAPAAGPSPPAGVRGGSGEPGPSLL